MKAWLTLCVEYLDDSDTDGCVLYQHIPVIISLKNPI